MSKAKHGPALSGNRSVIGFGIGIGIGVFSATLTLSLILSLPSSVQAQELYPLPSPLTLDDVLTYGRTHRQEIVAARARARAAEQRPAIVSALEDPMVMPSVDHLPFMMSGADTSLMFEQRFPLSGVLGHRRRAAEADARKYSAEIDRVTQDILLDATRSFLMLNERREVARVLDEQIELARQFVGASSARYGAGTSEQPDVLRAEIEVARLEGAIRVIDAEVASSESMLNTSLGRPPDAVVPSLEASALTSEPQKWSEIKQQALNRRPELEMGKAEISRAQSQIAEMRSMYTPMGFVRTGPAYTMSEGKGWMVTVGISIPLWRGKLDAGVREASAMSDMARADFAAMANMVEGEAAAARQQVLAARQRVLTLRDDIIPRTRQAVDPSLQAYAAGKTPLVSVIDVAQALWSAQGELIAAEYDLGLAWARLQRAQGQLGQGEKQ